MAACVPAMAGGTPYFSALPDLPLPAAMAEEANSAVRFDQPEGRVIVLQASGTAQPTYIKGFYQRTLPALGWKEAGPDRYLRAQESLTIRVNPLDASHNRLHILVKPQ